MKYYVLILGMLLLGSSLLFAQSHPPCRTSIPDLSSASLKQLGKEMQRLKAINTPDCEKFMSDLHKIMEEIQSRTDTTHIALKRWKRYMGKPDFTSYPPEYQSLFPLSPQQTAWIYSWRMGMHDCWFVIIENKKVKYVKWFYAYE